MSKKYITQITADELAAMLAAGNVKAGRGIKIDRSGDSLTISLDVDTITDIIWSYIQANMCSSVNANSILGTRGQYNTYPETYSSS